MEHVRVVDGDTVQATLRLGFGLERGVGIRLAGIDTAETRGGGAVTKAHGLEAKRYVTEWVDSCADPVAMILGEDKYGRSVGDLFCADRRLGADLLEERLAVPYDGGDREELQDLHRENAAWRAAQ